MHRCSLLLGLPNSTPSMASVKIITREYVYYMIPNVSECSANGVGRLFQFFSGVPSFLSFVTGWRSLCKSLRRFNAGILGSIEQSSTFSLLSSSSITFNVITMFSLRLHPCLQPVSSFTSPVLSSYRTLLLISTLPCQSPQPRNM